MDRKAVCAILCVLLAAVMLAGACLPAFAADKDTPEAIIQRIVRSYAYENKRNKKALKELADKDPALAEQWEQILDLWAAPVTVNKELPDGLPDDDTLCLAALGYQLNPDGSMRPELAGRLGVLLEAALKYPNAVIICSGGPTASRNRDVTEAGVMAEWLIENGIDPSRVVAEDQSMTTAENVILTFDILAERFPLVTQIVVISSDYHIKSGTLLFAAEAILRNSPVTVVSNAAWHAPSGSLSRSFEGSSLMELYRALPAPGDP